MTQSNETLRPDFEQALGEVFGEFISPPVPFEDASAHECCEVVWSVIGRTVTPGTLAAITDDQITALSQEFGTYFATEPPSIAQIKAAITQILDRWPVGSFGE